MRARLLPIRTTTSHLYLGTLTGWIYESRNGGAEWKRLAWVGKRDDLVLDSIVVDSGDPEAHSGWRVGAGQRGRRALCQQRWRRELGERAGDAGAVDSRARGCAIGSEDAGGGNAEGRLPVDRWRRALAADQPGGEPGDCTRSSPLRSIRPNPQIIYAGTWHLPWKTTDGGAHWTNIKQGIIDDSDVFSIIVDPKDPNVVYASACSGIYKS